MSNETTLNAASIFFTEANFLQLAADLKSHTDGDSYTELMNKWVELVHDPRPNYTDVENQEACLVAWDYMTDLSRVAKYQAQYFDEQELFSMLAAYMYNKFQSYITPDSIRVFVDREAAKIENKEISQDKKDLYVFHVKEEVLAAMDAKISEQEEKARTSYVNEKQSEYLFEFFEKAEITLKPCFDNLSHDLKQKRLQEFDEYKSDENTNFDKVKEFLLQTRDDLLNFDSYKKDNMTGWFESFELMNSLMESIGLSKVYYTKNRYEVMSYLSIPSIGFLKKGQFVVTEIADAATLMIYNQLKLT